MILKLIVKFTLAMCLIFTQITYGAIPSDIPLCHADEVDCIAKVATDFLRHNPNGRAALGIPKMDPLRISSIVINEGDQGPLTLKLVLKDVELRGFADAVVERVVGFSADPKTSKFELYPYFPKFNLKGKYKAGGRILVLPISGEGDCDITLEGVKTSVKFKPNLYVQNNKTYLEVKHFKTFLEPSKMVIRLDNLFNGDRILGDGMNRFLNENWKEVWTELGPSINVAIAEIVKNIMKNVFKTFAYEEMYRKD